MGKDAITDKTFAGLGFTGICFVGAVIMIGFGYLGEANLMDETIALLLGGMGWAMIMVATGLPFGLFGGLGDDSKIKEEVKWSTDALRTFILVGEHLPLGFLQREHLRPRQRGSHGCPLQHRGHDQQDRLRCRRLDGREEGHAAMA